jgi:hemerythrin
MPYIEWSSELSVGVPSLDEEHLVFIQTAHAFQLAVTRGQGTAGLGATLRELRDYATNHFDHEERWMREHAFPDTAAHVAEHEDFLHRLRDFEKRSDAPDTFLVADLVTYLQRWFANHVKQTDSRYAAFYRAHGLTRASDAQSP